jgi:hypothetical protein
MKKHITLISLLALSCGPEREKTDPSKEPSNNIYNPQDFEVDSDDPSVPSECPRRGNTTGLNVGDTFPAVQFPNADWDPVNIKSLCGNDAILVVAATEWCGACLVEFDYLAMSAPDWSSRGAQIYYTLFENGAGQPASSRTLVGFETYMMDVYGSVPFRVLADPSASLPRSLNGGVSLPIAWALDGGLVVRNFSEGTNGPMVAEWVEEILATPASPIF